MTKVILEELPVQFLKFNILLKFSVNVKFIILNVNVNPLFFKTGAKFVTQVFEDMIIDFRSPRSFKKSS